MGACPEAAEDLEMGSDSAHLKGTSPCPGQEDVLGLHPIGQEAVLYLPDRHLPLSHCSHMAPCALLPCLA